MNSPVVRATSYHLVQRSDGERTSTAASLQRSSPVSQPLVREVHRSYSQVVARDSGARANPLSVAAASFIAGGTNGVRMSAALRAGLVSADTNKALYLGGLGIGHDRGRGERLAEVLEATAHLGVLHLERNGLGRATSLAPVLNCLSRHQELATLDISNNDLRADGARALRASFAELAHLRELILGDSPMAPPTAHSLLPGCVQLSSLTALSLQGLSLRREGFAPFLARTFVLASLRSLDIGWNWLYPDDWSSLTPFVQRHAQLERLVLIGNQLGAIGADVLQSWLPILPALEELDIGQTRLQEPRAVAAVAAQAAAHGRLRYFDLRDNFIGDRGLRALQGSLFSATIEWLELSESCLTPHAVPTLRALILQLPALSLLGLARNGLGSAALTELVPSLQDGGDHVRIDMEGNELASAVETNVEAPSPFWLGRPPQQAALRRRICL